MIMKKGAKSELLAKSWTVVASEYDRRLAPLFLPWIDQLLNLFIAQSMPKGSVLAPACGPGFFLPDLHLGIRLSCYCFHT